MRQQGAFPKIGNFNFLMVGNINRNAVPGFLHSKRFGVGIDDDLAALASRGIQQRQRSISPPAHRLAPQELLPAIAYEYPFARSVIANVIGVGR